MARVIEIRSGVPPGARPDLIRLFCEAFPEMVAPIFGTTDRCASLLNVSIEPSRVLVALDIGRLVGFAGMNYNGSEWFDPRLGDLVRTLGRTTARVALLGWPFIERPKTGELRLETLAVVPSRRGEGIGTALVNAVVECARKGGMAGVALSVLDSNPRAKAFYERAGFVVERFKPLPWPWRARFPFNGAYRMRYALAGSQTGTPYGPGIRLRAASEDAGSEGDSRMDTTAEQAR